jgi:hypothetical protein
VVVTDPDRIRAEVIRLRAEVKGDLGELHLAGAEILRRLPLGEGS